MTPEREEKIKKVIARRQVNLSVILENVHDTHNIGAVLRSCDAVGVKEIFVLFSDPKLDQERITLGKRTSGGSRRWVDVHFYTQAAPCFEHVRANYPQIWSTHIHQEARSLYELDLTQSVALLFGNEHQGISAEALSYTDGNFIIPQMGMCESLNISVACAVSLFEALRQRQLAGYYEDNPTLSPERQRALFQEYCRRHNNKDQGHFSWRLND